MLWPTPSNSPNKLTGPLAPLLSKASVSSCGVLAGGAISATDCVRTHPVEATTEANAAPQSSHFTNISKCSLEVVMSPVSREGIASHPQATHVRIDGFAAPSEVLSLQGLT